MQQDPKFPRELFEQLVFKAIGSASMCWTDIPNAGKFKSEEARTIGEELITRIMYIVND